MPPFSRLQLAAALIEYDNDPDDPDAPYRSAESSAIFSFLRGRPNPRNTLMGYDEMPRKSVDYLGVTIPNEGHGQLRSPAVGGRMTPNEPPMPTSRRQSMEMLANGRKTPDGRRSMEPYGRPSSEMQNAIFRGHDDEDDDDDLHDTPEVNLASWGVDEFLVKEQPRARSRASSVNAYNRAASPGPSMRPSMHERVASTASAGLGSVPAQRGANRRSDGQRAMSAGDWGVREQAVDFEGVDKPRTSTSSGRPRPTSVADLDDLAAQNQHPPISYRARAGSVSGLQQVAFPSSARSESVHESNPFEIPPPSPTHTSRFDPKATAHQRNISFASLSTHRILDANRDVPDNASVMAGPLRHEPPSRYSRADILRPKVLVMPAPLQEQEEANAPAPRPVREGFQDSTDSRPLPPGAKTVGASTYGTGGNHNYRSSMTLSQLTFRNSLMVGGQRDPSFVDLERHLRRAEHEGEMIQQEMEPELELALEEPMGPRAPGKLYGRSLIDDLEARKAQLKSKQRVFRGDDRPSMMQRPQPRRGNTLIDAEDLHQPAQSSAPRPQMMRNASSQEPLVNFRDDPVPGTNLRPNAGRTGTGLTTSRSVFGVDPIWERELEKLKVIEAQEKAEAEEQQRLEDEKAAKKAAKRSRGKNKSIDNFGAFVHSGDHAAGHDPEGSPIPRASAEPPLLPAVDPFPMPPPAQPESDSDSDNEREVERRRAASRMRTAGPNDEWLSDDEREALARRIPPRVQPPATAKYAAGLRVGDSDSDEDIPLTSALVKARQRQEAEDSEEDKPLATVLKKSISTFDFGGTVLAEVAKPPLKKQAADSDSDDDKPLGLRPVPSQSRFLSVNNPDDEDQPLGLRYSVAGSQMFGGPQQQQQQQFMMQQMMQQQMMAQMQGSMFNPMMMGGSMPTMGMPMGFPPMGMNPPMMPMGPGSFTNPAPPADQATYGRVDRWRRDVGASAD
ncbi:SubName: Full=Uncharacterized protein {ECO:0000313/EMBL:CCA71681.1} [Serendipita indica DSM 11827]|uniref:Uncharacterized protein n=1 Tax=Serendipita indica (strain DSM 11827) TaxID=1109443 RepID=G4TK38_SERID|nr:SubName: Full=Uncharacterized protein {ECO:0000313/EMBL:CCA71681.1} [Serendipita indica DSM 11827]CCA71681.1 hypothetical protein PIIN_05616 [Serendipita indica DSM 11827]